MITATLVLSCDKQTDVIAHNENETRIVNCTPHIVLTKLQHQAVLRAMDRLENVLMSFRNEE